MVKPALLFSLALTLSGCLAPTSLEHAVLAYDEATTEVLAKQLLLNIARARFHQPLHFTGISNIAATYNFQVNAGVTPALTGESSNLILPIIGGSASENPTISIIPIEGEEFTKRLLTPFQDNKLTLLLRQRADIDLVLRLMAAEFRLVHNGQEIAYHNQPSDTVGYSVFRRIVLHLSSIQDNNELYVEPLVFTQQWTLPESSVSADAFQSLQKEYSITYDPKQHLYHLTKQVIGRIIITNYDPDILSNVERIRTNDSAMKSPPNELLVDIRPGYPGGDYPIQGAFRLRSFHYILNFLGRGIVEEPEYPVDKDPRTPIVTENPAKTLDIIEAPKKPASADTQVQYHGNYYSLHPEQGYQWNHEGFRLLYQLFQMTVTELPQALSPTISIAK